MTSLVQVSDDLLYPSGDGKPMAENTEQYRWIVIIKENLEILYAAIADVFIAADLLWYPISVEIPPAPREAPDVMVIIGRPKGKRRSYQQWKEGNVGPQVVFEILSPSNKTRRGEDEMEEKFRFYQQYGVEEYYLYDLDELILGGWQRRGDELVPICDLDQWISPRLGIRFEWQPRQELVLYYPDGRRFLSSVELAQQAEQAEQALFQLTQALRNLDRNQLKALGIDPKIWE